MSMAKRSKRKDPTAPSSRETVGSRSRPIAEPPRTNIYYALLALVLLVMFAAYLPAMRGGFIWDDDGHITKPELRSLPGLYRIWFEVGATQQYYPLLHSAFWLEHKLWGDNTLGYHLTNTAQHAIAVCLLYLILMRLKIPGALLAAAIFAVHPIEVESVAWVTEQKNTLSAVFYLAAMRVYLEFDERRAGSYYALAFGLFVLGMLTKTVTATLPAALLVIFWWQRGAIDWKRDVLPLVPFFVVGAIGGCVTAYVERHLIGAQGVSYEIGFLERVLLAGRVAWFYLGKLLWPANLVFIYPRWTPDARVWWQWLFPLAAVAMTVFLWSMRKRSRAPLAGWLYFVGTLFPVLGFLNVYPFIYSYVADHFQYLAGLGIIVPVAAWVTRAVSGLQPTARVAGQVVCGAVVAVLAICTFNQAAMYGNIETLYRTTITRNPQCWLAYNNLGAYLGTVGRDRESELLFREALRLRPDYAEALMNLGVHLAESGDRAQGIELFQRALAIRPSFSQAELSWGNALASEKNLTEARKHFEAAAALDPKAAMPPYNLGNTLLNMNDVPGAIEKYETAVRLKPDFVEAQFNLGIALVRAGRMPEAVDRFREAVALRPTYVEGHYNLGLALVELKRDAEAVDEFRKVIELDPKSVVVRPDLAKAYARLQRSDEAIGAAQEAAASARASGQVELADKIEGWLVQYREHLKKAEPVGKQP